MAEELPHESNENLNDATEQSVSRHELQSNLLDYRELWELHGGNPPLEAIEKEILKHREVITLLKTELAKSTDNYQLQFEASSLECSKEAYVCLRVSLLQQKVEQALMDAEHFATESNPDVIERRITGLVELQSDLSVAEEYLNRASVSLVNAAETLSELESELLG